MGKIKHKVEVDLPKGAKILRESENRSKKTAGKEKRTSRLREKIEHKFPKTKVWWEKIELRKAERIQPHRSFRRTYREDYQRDLKIPGIMNHIFTTFGMIFKNWKVFLPLLLIAVLIDVFLVGLMSEEKYLEYQQVFDTTNAEIAGGQLGSLPKAGLLLMASITSGGLAGSSDEAAMVFMVIVFIMLWLVTTYLLRQKLAQHKVKLRDALYNAPQALVPTFLVFLIAVFQCIPIIILVVAYSAAVSTDFLSTPFYALVFFIFAALMILLSGYLLSSSLIALVAVSAPGLYPLKALQAASDLMQGRRFRFILRLVAVFVTMIIVWVVVMLPIIAFDLFIKENVEWINGFPLVPICLNVMTCFTMIYVTAYLYLYYRWMLDGGPKEDE